MAKTDVWFTATQNHVLCVTVTASEFVLQHSTVELTCMFADMDDQKVFPGIAGFTQTTLVWTVTCVSTSVNHQVSLVGEPGIAVLANIWFLTCTPQNERIHDWHICMK